jgi:glycerophosphoryl diester phosphodiesterase
VADHRFAPDAFPEIVAHRGASSTRPENTTSAFEEAVRLGARIVEFDVRLTADAVPVVMHDPTVDRTTDGTGAVHELTLAQIRGLVVGQGDRVPTLDETLALLSGRAAVAIEIKNLPGEPAFEATAESIVDATHASLARTAFDGPVLVVSFNPASIAASRVIDASVPTGFLTTRLVPPDDALAHAVASGHEMVLPGTWSLEPVGAAFVRRAHEAKVRVGTWTVDDADGVRRFVEMGVDAIASNDPRMALEALRAG